MGKIPSDYFGAMPQGARDAFVTLTPKVLGSPEWNPKRQWNADKEALSYRIFGAMVRAFKGTGGALTVSAALDPAVGYRRVDVVYDVEHGHIVLVPADTFARLCAAFGGYDAHSFASAIAMERPRFQPTHGGDRAKAWAAVEARLADARKVRESASKADKASK